MSKYSLYWDNTVKALAKEVVEKADADKECLQHFVSGLIFAVEHDLADGREVGLMTLNSLGQVSATLTDDGYYKNVHGGTPEEETKRLWNLGREVKKLMEIHMAEAS